MWETYDEMMALRHMLDCDLVGADLPCNCDGRPTCFWVTPIRPGDPERKPNWLLATGYSTFSTL